MNNLLLKNIARWIILILVQVLILNNINFGGYLNPYLYVLFIIMLPFETPGWLLLSSAFLLGLGVDIFGHTTGLHTAACVFMAFMRPITIKIVTSKKEYEPGMTPSIKDLGIWWFTSYALLLITFHHITLYFLETLRLTQIFSTLFHSLSNTIFTFFFVIITQLLFFHQKS